MLKKEKAVEEEPAVKNALERGVNRGVERGVNHGVERGAEKRELIGVDKGVMVQRVINIIINSISQI